MASSPDTLSRSFAGGARAPAPTPARSHRSVVRMLREHDASLVGRRVLAMCSGGVDSVTLVEVVATLPRGARPRTIDVLFVDHGLHDVAGDRMASQAVAATHGLTWYERRLAGALGEGPNLQARARELRYVAAIELATDRDCDVVVTGHTADDQLETLLYGLVAASGLQALNGIPVSRQLAPGLRVVRPLLSLNRSQVQRLALERGRFWHEDPSNATRRFRRNVIRHDVVPALLAVHGGAAANIERSRAAIGNAGAAIDDLVRVLLAQATRDGGTALDVRALQPLGDAACEAVIATWLRTMGLGRGLSARLVRSVVALARADAATPPNRPGPTVQVRGACVVRDRYDVRFTPR